MGSFVSPPPIPYSQAAQTLAAKKKKQYHNQSYFLSMIATLTLLRSRAVISNADNCVPG